MKIEVFSARVGMLRVRGGSYERFARLTKRLGMEMGEALNRAVRDRLGKR